jgi:hypothetical protein
MVLLALMPADAAAHRRGWHPYLLGDDLRGISGSIAVQIGGR